MFVIQQCCLTTSKQRKMCKMSKNFSVMLFLSASIMQWNAVEQTQTDGSTLPCPQPCFIHFFSAQHPLLILFIPIPSPSTSPPPPCLKTPPPVFSPSHLLLAPNVF